MRADEIKLAKQIANVLIDLFPIGGLGKNLVKISFDHFFGNAERRSSHVSIEKLSQEIAAQLEAIPLGMQDNPGSAQSAACDIANILRKSSLGPTRLIALNLDVFEVENYLLTFANEYIAGASAERTGFIETNIKLIAQAIVLAAPELPGVPLAFMQAMLKSRNPQSH